MKQFIKVLVLVFLVAGCSKSENNSFVSQPTATDLEKDSNYFSNLYGPAKSQKQVNEYDFSLPSIGHLIKLNQHFVIQQYTDGKLNATVLFREPSPQAIWVKYTLPNPWTQEQIKAALGAFDQKWTAADQSLGLTFIMQDRAPIMYQSSSKIIAYKTMVNELEIYSPPLFQELRQKMADEEQQKRAVPKF
ncbi:MAG TPA: hypothetical protein VFC85_07045 [Verrucomicrobiae bacterium]|nr:hypothetical protein [Verrucomicrobiae bacterium]